MIDRRQMAGRGSRTWPGLTCRWVTADAGSRSGRTAVGCRSRWSQPTTRSRVGVDTGITLATSDAETDHASLVWRGVDADEVLHWPGVPAMFIFCDQDGNQLKVMEKV